MWPERHESHQGSLHLSEEAAISAMAKRWKNM
jgi:hypothetical protein